ncbi:glycosyltransferase involved in cell wall biosynthesis [Microbacterium sp. SORGH_AS 862]|nr:glycosyltransferase involved in cell wall biosynthesis [Microbacterium sp. SORGH_AS_0862]
MRILHVVTYISSDGAFGGPVRVARSQAAELARRGHQVTVVSAAPPAETTDIMVDGYRLRTFPGALISQRFGFAGMRSAALNRFLQAEIGRSDLVHIHLARDLITLPAALAAKRASVPYVLQPHGMVDASDRLLAGPVDLVATRPALRHAAMVLALTSEEATDLKSVCAAAQVHQIKNGLSRGEAVDAVSGSPSDTKSMAGRVLFLARLHSRKRPVAFVQMATLLHARGRDYEYIIAGPDEGEGETVALAISRSPARIRWIGPVDPNGTDELMKSAEVYVLPSVGEVFPMSILEAFRARTPVVATTSLGIAEKCAEYRAAALTDGSPQELADAVDLIIQDSNHRDELRAGAQAYFEAELGIEAVVDELVEHYSRAVTAEPNRS